MNKDEGVRWDFWYSKKILSCVFFADVLCSFRQSEKLGIMNRCLTCEHYRRFLQEMAEEDEMVMDEIDDIGKRGYRDLNGELR